MIEPAARSNLDSRCLKMSVKSVNNSVARRQIRFLHNLPRKLLGIGLVEAVQIKTRIEKVLYVGRHTIRSDLSEIAELRGVQDGLVRDHLLFDEVHQRLLWLPFVIVNHR